MRINKIVLTFFILLCLTSCTPAQNKFYSYKIDSYNIDSTNRLLTTNRLIAYGDYLFEFKLYTNSMDEFTNEQGEVKLISSKVTYDTIGVYILTNKRKYFEFDTFALSGKLIKQGDLADKQFGYKFNVQADEQAGSEADLKEYWSSFSDPVDTIINDVKCSFIEMRRSAVTSSDSAAMRFYLIKANGLTSFFKLYGLNWIKKEYCIVAFYRYQYGNGYGYLQEPSGLRLITAQERAICENLIKKAGLPLPR